MPNRFQPKYCYLAILLILSILGEGPRLHAQFATDWVRGLYGGNYSDRAMCVELDRQSNMITAGTYNTGTIDFDPGPGTLIGPPVIHGTGFVEKLDSNGLMLWVRFFEAPNQPVGIEFGMHAMDVDSVGNIYLAITNRYGFDADPGPANVTLPATGGGQVAVVKLDPAGNLIWAFQFGGYTSDLAFDIHVLPGGDFLLSGFFVNAADFDPGPGVTSLNAGSIGATFFAKYTSSGALVWVKSITSTIFGNFPGPITMNAAGECYLSGSVRGTADIDPGPGVVSVTATSQRDMYLIKLDAAGNLLWSHFWGGGGHDQSPARLLIDSQDHIIFTYVTHGSMDLDPGPATVNYTNPFGTDDGIITKFTPSGQMQWYHAVNFTTFDKVDAIDLDGQDNIYFGHWFTDAHDFDPGPGVTILTSSPLVSTAYVCYLDSSGIFQDAWQITDSAPSIVAALAIRPDGTGYAAGDCGVLGDFDIGPGIVSPGCPSAVNIYFWKWLPCNTSSTTSVTACDSFAWGGQTYLTSGNYSQTLTNISGCDSVLNLQLTITHPTTETLLFNGCDSIQVNGQTYTLSGNYNQMLTNTLGCDSTLFLLLTIGQTSASSDTVRFCNDTIINGQFFNASGTYQQTLQNQSGCDSILTLNLTQVPLDTTVTVSAGVLQAQPGATTYQWLDCENNLDPIPGATQSIYDPILNGTFAVAISNGLCTDTSGCHLIVHTTATPSNLAEAKIFPSPTSGTVYIQLPPSSKKFRVKVHNSLGQCLATYQFQNSQATIHLPYPPGYYNLQITNQSGLATNKRILIQR